jgi:hypothetical protein
MAANYFQLPLSGIFQFGYDHPLPIPQRWIPERGARLSAYLQTQFELSQPGGGPDPYAHVEFDGVTSINLFQELLSSHLQAFQKGANFAFSLLLSVLSGLIYYFFSLPFNAICHLVISLDWWLVFSFFLAVVFSSMTSPEWLADNDGPAKLEVVLEYELVKDFRRWGMSKKAA